MGKKRNKVCEIPSSECSAPLTRGWHVHVDNVWVETDLEVTEAHAGLVLEKTWICPQGHIFDRVYKFDSSCSGTQTNAATSKSRDLKWWPGPNAETPECKGRNVVVEESTPAGPFDGEHAGVAESSAPASTVHRPAFRRLREDVEAQKMVKRRKLIGQLSPKPPAMPPPAYLVTSHHISPAGMDKCVSDALIVAGLKRFIDPLLSLGVEQVCHLKYVRSEELRSMGMSIIQQRVYVDISSGMAVFSGD